MASLLIPYDPHAEYDFSPFKLSISNPGAAKFDAEEETLITFVPFLEKYGKSSAVKTK